MENKYYVPTQEEFRIGFEYEYKYNENNSTDKGWTKRIFDGNNFEISDKTEVSKFTRVKYLDQEDIESLGWDYDKYYPFQRIKGDERIAFTKNENKLGLHRLVLNGNKVLIYLETEFVHEGFFKGTIKNKSELKVLLKQLGI